MKLTITLAIVDASDVSSDDPCNRGCRSEQGPSGKLMRNHFALRVMSNRSFNAAPFRLEDIQ